MKAFELPQGWEYRSLFDMVDVISGVSYTPSDITTSGIRIIRGGNIQDNIVSLRDDDVYLPYTYRDEENSLRGGDIVLVASTGSVEALGRTATVWKKMDSVQIGAFLRILRPKEKKYAEFLSATLSGKFYLNYIQTVAKGTSINNISQTHLKELRFPVPSDTELKKISKLYSSLSKRINLNRSIIQNLESLSKQLYDYWFVQFDFPDKNGRPYKSSGNEMVYNEELHREIPSGWKKATLLDLACFTNGLACQNYRPKEGEGQLPVIKIKEMHEGYTADTEAVTINIPEDIKIHNGDILFSWSASLEVMQWAFGEGGLNQHIFKVTGNNGYPKSFYYFQLLDYVSIFRKIAEARKTTMGHITQDHLKQSKVAVPKDKAVLMKFESVVKPIMDKQVQLAEEISSLKQLRDFLLPLLMTGQVSPA